MALFTAERVSNLSGDLARYALASIDYIAIDGKGGPANVARLRNQSWFMDGLTSEEAAFITALPAPRSDPNLFGDLLQTHYTQRKTIVTH